MSVNSPAKHLVEPVKLFAAVLYRDAEPLAEASRMLTGLFGPEDFRSEPVEFDHTAFYEPEMGAPLHRLFVSYARLVPPDALARIKHDCDRIERELAGPDGGRTVNIDPGLVDYQKVVLASFKYGGQKICVGRGVWADLTLYYRKGGWAKFEWTFPDFKAGRYDRTLLEIRGIYKRQRREPAD